MNKKFILLIIFYNINEIDIKEYLYSNIYIYSNDTNNINLSLIL